jgi:serine protease AprX
VATLNPTPSNRIQMPQSLRKRLFGAWLVLFYLAWNGSNAVFAAPVKVWVHWKDKAVAQAPASLPWQNAPVRTDYLAELKRRGFQPDVVLKWQNCVSGWIESSRLHALRSAPGVASVTRFHLRRKAQNLPTKGGKSPLAKKSAQLDSTFFQLQEALGGIGAQVLRDSLRLRGEKPGQGIRIAVLDADFDLGSAAFQAMRDSGRIVDQYDFTQKRSQAVTTQFTSSHGASVLSVIGGDLPGFLQGAAPYAHFLLYRTEVDAIESFLEEDYLAAAMERAVDSGAQVVNISLGYRYEFDSVPDVPYQAMDGKSRPSSIAVSLAAQRNVLVTVSVGNLPGFDSQDGTPTLQAPADADGILAVGIADLNGKRCSYSCWGPTSDGRIKPDLLGLGPNGCGVPVVDPLRDSATFVESGTSFSAPALAGVAALLRQAFPQAKAAQIREALMRTATLGAKPSDSLGFGMTQADLAWKYLAGDSLGWIAKTRQYYGPRKWAYFGNGAKLNLRALPFAIPPNSMRDMLGRAFPVQSQLDSGRLWLQPTRLKSLGVYFLP